jgi:hypothetical protein
VTRYHDHRYRLATTEAGLAKGANFFILRLPRPDLVTYADHATRFPAGRGGESRQGFESVSVLWNRLSASQAATLRRIIEAAEVTGGQGNGTLYLTLPKANAGGEYWIDVSGIALMPEWTPEGGEAQGYVNVLLRLNAVTVENDPSTVGV